MGKIKSINFLTLPEKIKQHNIDVFIKDNLKNLVENSYSIFDSNETLFRKLIDNYLGKYCFDANKQMIEITLPLLEQEVSIRAGKSITCPIEVKTIPAHNRKKKAESDLFIEATLKNLVRHAVKDRGNGSVDDLFATLIYNYLGKWCHDENGQLIQVNIALLEAQLRHLLKDANIKCRVDVDAILLAKTDDLIREENACTKAVAFDGSQWTTEKHLLFFLRQMHDPENIRKKSPNGVTGRYNYDSKYSYPERKYKPKQQDNNRDQRIKPGTLSCTKTSVSITPTKPGYMKNYDRDGIILLFAFSEVHHAKKYLFRENGNTNFELHYSSFGGFRPPSNAQYYAPLKSIIKQNRDAVKSWLGLIDGLIEWNEVKAGVPKRGIRAVIATGNYASARLYALESMYIIKNTFGLDYDLPVGINRYRDSTISYEHEQRVRDVIAAQWYLNKTTDDKKAFFQNVVNSSWNKLQDQSLKNELNQLCNRHGFTMPEAENYTPGSYKRYNHTLHVASSRMYIDEILPPAVTISPPGEKILSVAGMLTFFPMVGYGAYKWMKDSIGEDMDVGWEDFGKILGIMVATITLLPAFAMGCYYAIPNLVAPSRMEAPASKRPSSAV